MTFQHTYHGLTYFHRGLKGHAKFSSTQIYSASSSSHFASLLLHWAYSVAKVKYPVCPVMSFNGLPVKMFVLLAFWDIIALTFRTSPVAGSVSVTSVTGLGKDVSMAALQSTCSSTSFSSVWTFSDKDSNACAVSSEMASLPCGVDAFCSNEDKNLKDYEDTKHS